MFQQIQEYLAQNLGSYLESLWQHLELSFSALFIAMLIGLPLGYLGYQHKGARVLTSGLTQALRVIPSLGILFLLIPFIGVGKVPALIALVILAVPPILINTILGFSEVSETRSGFLIVLISLRLLDEILEVGAAQSACLLENDLAALDDH